MTEHQLTSVRTKIQLSKAKQYAAVIEIRKRLVDKLWTADTINHVAQIERALRECDDRCEDLNGLRVPRDFLSSASESLGGPER